MTEQILPPAAGVDVSILQDPATTAEQAVDEGCEEHVTASTWEDVLARRWSGLAWWPALGMSWAVVVKGRLVAEASGPWQVEEGWVLSDGTRARCVGEAVAWGERQLESELASPEFI